MTRRMTAARSLRSPVQRLSLSSRRSRRRLWSASVSRAPTFLRKAASCAAGISYSTHALTASALARGFVLVGGQRRCEGAKPDARRRRRVGEEGLDLARTGGAVEQRFLGALVEQAAVGPGRDWPPGRRGSRRPCHSRRDRGTSRPACGRPASVIWSRSGLALAQGRRSAMALTASRMRAASSALSGQVAGGGDGRIVAGRMLRPPRARGWGAGLGSATGRARLRLRRRVGFGRRRRASWLPPAWVRLPWAAALCGLRLGGACLLFGVFCAARGRSRRSQRRSSRRTGGRSLSVSLHQVPST